MTVHHEKEEWSERQPEKNSDRVRVHHEKKSDGLRVQHEKKSDGVRVQHKKE